MTPADPTELVLIRHAPSRGGGRLAGRRDVPADLPDAATLAATRALIGPVTRIVTSPARRCRETAQALFPGPAAPAEARLWEQDFGAWEGADPAGLPDLGPLAPADLARHRPPGGESFADLVARTGPALREIAGLPGRTALVAHAGTVRAALALALGTVPAALAFEIAPLSVTSLRALPGGVWSLGFVNRVAVIEAMIGAGIPGGLA